MALSKAMADRFKSAKPPKFGDEGEPEGDEQSRGSGEGADDMSAPDSQADMGPAGPGGLMGPSDPAEQLADILGVGPEDRDDFAAALKAYVHECLADTMAPEPAGGEMPGAAQYEGEPGDSAAGV